MAVERKESKAIDEILMLGRMVMLSRMWNERFVKEKCIDAG
jgi:hypothetical protein